MSSITSLEYWNIPDFKMFFVLVSGTVEDHSGMSNDVTSLEYFVLQISFTLVKTLVEDLKNVSHVTRLEYSILQNIFYIGGSYLPPILAGALVLCLE